jgi:hypothetical protein
MTAVLYATTAGTALAGATAALVRVAKFVASVFDVPVCADRGHEPEHPALMVTRCVHCGLPLTKERGRWS